MQHFIFATGNPLVQGTYVELRYI